MKYQFTLEPNLLELELKKLIVQESDKDDVVPEEIDDNEPLFGEQSRIQLDSLDALQIAVALQAHFKVRLQGDRMVRKHMMNVADLATFIRTEHQK
ncbi:acyl carrier protein [Conservatibacter flavescens]|uniref:Acyl carrier protein n=2 Tax=Conservatibacter flavescens TaxID=28161 RepID=A0A2M8S2R0_9PAST|nr:acyl carrier protein [Conservatibacter flavescens]